MRLTVRATVPAVARLAAASLTVASLTAACGGGSGIGSAATDSAAGAVTAAAVAKAPAPRGAERGALIDARPFDGAATALPGMTATTIVYRSTSGVDGRGTDVTGTVLTPPGTPPEGGWPIVTVGHGTTGVTDECAPSRYPDLLGTINLANVLLARGYVVAVSDYEGLGTPDPHPYLEPNTAAYNLIDAARAARNAVPGTSTRWAALGVSQGGQASWAAAEHATDYGDGLDFVGAASLSPVADLSPVAAGDGPARLTLPQQMLLPMLLEGLQVLHPDLDQSAYLRGKLAQNHDTFLACTPPLVTQKVTAAGQLSLQDSLPRTEADAVRMHEWLTEIALPKQRASGPMLVVVGGQDMLIPPRWTRDAVEKACALGDVIEFRWHPDQGHADGPAVPEAVDWIAARFAGVAPSTTCPTR